MWSAEAQTQRKMSMPIDKSATFAPLHMQDMMMFVAFLVSEHGHRFTQTMYELTGREQLTCDDIVQKCNEKLNTDIGCMLHVFMCVCVCSDLANARRVSLRPFPNRRTTHRATNRATSAQVSSQ